jgi:hypothetical protein
MKIKLNTHTPDYYKTDMGAGDSLSVWFNAVMQGEGQDVVRVIEQLNAEMPRHYLYDFEITA